MSRLFNTGRDVSLDFIGPNGVPVPLAIITDFHRKQDTASLESGGLDGTERFRELPKGWSGAIKMDRATRNLDDVIDALEQQYYQGQDISQLVITETIKEVDNTISQWRYEGVAIKMDEGGNWRKDAKTEQGISFRASFRKKVV